MSWSNIIFVIKDVNVNASKCLYIVAAKKLSIEGHYFIHASLLPMMCSLWKFMFGKRGQIMDTS